MNWPYKKHVEDMEAAEWKSRAEAAEAEVERLRKAYERALDKQYRLANNEEAARADATRYARGVLALEAKVEQLQAKLEHCNDLAYEQNMGDDL